MAKALAMVLISLPSCCVDQEMEQEPEGMSALLAAVRLQPESRCPAVMGM